jgi:putative SOS response-associated peptidase YedK
MCGRYAITLPPEAVRAFFAFAESPSFPPRYNIAPTQPIPVVVAAPQSRGGARHFQLMRWGFLPGFVKDPKTFPLLINAARRRSRRSLAFAPRSGDGAV